MKRKRSFSTRLSLNILLVTSILFILAIGAASLSAHKLIAEEAETSAERLLDATIKDIEKSLKEIEVAVEVTGWIADGRRDDPEALYYLTSEMVRRTDKVVGCAIAFSPYYFEGQYFFSPYSYRDTETGEVHSKQLGNPAYDYFFMDWYQIPALSGKPCWSEPYFDDGGGSYYMTTYSFPLKDSRGQVYAVVTADVSVDWITEMLENVRPYTSSHASLVSRSGAYVNIDNNSSMVGETVFSTLKYVSDDRNDEIDSLVISMMSGQKGMRRYFRGTRMSFAVYGPLTNGWILSISCDYREVLARISQMQILLIFIGLIGLLLIFIFCYIIIRKLTEPLTTFSYSALRIAKGDFTATLPEIKSDDEIRELRDSFDYMQHSLVDYINNLKTTTAANERYASELNVASRIQMAMLPKDFPEHESYGLYAILKPAKEVGGDLYDFLQKGDKLYFTVGDVSGKGIPASMVMAIARSSFHFLSNLEFSVDQLANGVNEALSDGNDTGMFVTMFIGCLDLKTNVLEYCNMGHNPIVADGKFLDVKPNLAAGLFPGFPYQKQSIQLGKGSRLVLYTDGVTEAERADKQQFGDPALLEWAASATGITNEKEACESLLDAVRGFTMGNEQNDDITIMTLKIR